MFVNSVHEIPSLLTKLSPVLAVAREEKPGYWYSIATGKLFPGVVSFTTTENLSPFLTLTGWERVIVW
jgi:hypothetical protein